MLERSGEVGACGSKVAGLFPPHWDRDAEGADEGAAMTSHVRGTALTRDAPQSCFLPSAAVSTCPGLWSAFAFSDQRTFSIKEKMMSHVLFCAWKVPSGIFRLAMVRVLLLLL